MGHYEVKSSHVAHHGVFLRVRVDEVAMPDGTVRRREVVETQPAVAVVALDDQGRVTLLRQYRHPLAQRVLEVPAGKLDVEGEEPLAAARRELAEEAGLAAGTWELLTRFQNSGGWTDEHTSVYLATDLRPVAQPHGFEAEAEESDMEVLRVQLDDAIGLVQNGEISDAKTVIGLLLAARHP